MIIRILGEGQYRVSSAYLDKLNEIDNQLVEVVATKDDDRFQALMTQMLDMVRKQGEALPPNEILTSDVILPPSDTTLEEAEGYFAGEGAIPG